MVFLCSSSSISCLTPPSAASNVFLWRCSLSKCCCPSSAATPPHCSLAVPPCPTLCASTGSIPPSVLPSRHGTSWVSAPLISQNSCVVLMCPCNILNLLLVCGFLFRLQSELPVRETAIRCYTWSKNCTCNVLGDGKSWAPEGHWCQPPPCTPPSSGIGENSVCVLSSGPLACCYSVCIMRRDGKISWCSLSHECLQHLSFQNLATSVLSQEFIKTSLACRFTHVQRMMGWWMVVVSVICIINDIAP